MMFHLQTKCFSSRAIRSIVSNTGYFPEYSHHSNTDINDQSSFSKLFIIQKRKKSIYPTIDKQHAYYFHPGNKPLRNETIGQLLKEAAEKWPNHECIVSHHQKVRLTFSDVLLRVDKLAAGMKKLGLKKGDRIGIFGPNDVEWFITFFCSTRLGLINTAINSAYQRDELIYCLQKVGAKAIFIPVQFKTQNYVNMVLSAKEFCPDLEHIIVWSKDHVTGTRRLIDVESLASKIEVEAISAEQGNVSSYDACNIQFTSGTTGKPKATLLSHRSFVNNVEQGVNRRELRLGHKSCLNVPLFHAFGIIYGQISTILSGCTTILESRSFDPMKSLQVMAEEKCDVIYGTPTMWINMINAQQQLRLPIQVRMGIIGGAPVSSELHKRVKDILGIDDMKVIYGLTELTGIVFQSLPGEDKTLTENTVGYASDNIEVMVVNEMGDPVPFGTPGELWVRGYNTMICYYKDPENTKKILTEDGWLKTGDQFILQSNGYGQIIGRIKDLIIRGGENIFPKEIEDFLITHPSIIEAQCIGAYDEIYGEEICACIHLFEGASLSEKELKAYCKGKIAHFKIPKYVVFVDTYPKTVSGKIQKGKLKEELEGKGVIPSRPK